MAPLRAGRQIDKLQELVLEQAIEKSDDPAGEEHCNQRAHMDAHQLVDEDSPNAARDQEAGQVKHIFTQAKPPVDALAHHIGKGIGWIWHQIHVDNHGHTHTSEGDGKQKQTQPLDVAGQLNLDPGGEEIDQPTGDKAHGDLQEGQKGTATEIQHIFHGHTEDIKNKSDRAKAPSPDGGNPIGNRDDRGDAQARLGIEHQSQG